MTPIDPVRRGISGVGRARAAGAAAAPGMQPAGGAFHVTAEGGSGAAEASGPLAEAMPVSLGMMMAAEELDRDAMRDRAARRHGLVMLGGLTALQRALLEGGDTAVSLDRLGALLADMPQAAEPRLAALLGTIALRVKVELALLDGVRDWTGPSGRSP
jgi:hypothetical protein